jgi:hypothetical protein
VGVEIGRAAVDAEGDQHRRVRDIRQQHHATGAHASNSARRLLMTASRMLCPLVGLRRAVVTP